MKRRLLAPVVMALALFGLLASPIRAGAAAGWAFETLDGNGEANAQPVADVGQYNASILYGGQPHNWYYDNTNHDLRHAWWNGTAWQFETLDGFAGSNGRTTNNVGLYISVTIYNDEPHVFYYNNTAGDLRHAWWNGTDWVFETLDGNGGPNGASSANVGRYTTVTLYGGQPHVFYYQTVDVMTSVGGDLRHGWWNGVAWVFETLDGATAGPNGENTNNVGQFGTVILYGGQPHVWYHDNSFGDLRHGWWTGAFWAFETLDGVGGSNGRTANNVGEYTAATLYAGQPHVWYDDVTGGDLRHGWWTGSFWQFETLDGNGGANGETANIVGTYNAVTLLGEQPHVYYYDATGFDLRHGWWTGAVWQFETLDGNGGTAGETANDVGTFNAVTVYGGQAHVFYYDGSSLDLRHGWG